MSEVEKFTLLLRTLAHELTHRARKTGRLRRPAQWRVNFNAFDGPYVLDCLFAEADKDGGEQRIVGIGADPSQAFNRAVWHLRLHRLNLSLCAPQPHQEEGPLVHRDQPAAQRAEPVFPGVVQDQALARADLQLAGIAGLVPADPVDFRLAEVSPLALLAQEAGQIAVFFDFGKGHCGSPSISGSHSER